MGKAEDPLVKRVEVGRVYITRGVSDLVARDSRFARLVMEGLRRHASGDWGEVCKEDREANDEALVRGGRLLSAYEAPGLPKVWIITEADRSATTVLFPDEY
jgi:hypothetical protein